MGEYETALPHLLNASRELAPLGDRMMTLLSLIKVSTLLMTILESGSTASQSQPMPDYLPRIFEEISEQNWRSVLLATAREKMLEAERINQELGLPPESNEVSTLLAQADAAEGRSATLLELVDTLSAAWEDDLRANVLYQALRLADIYGDFPLSTEKKEEMRIEAIEFYQRYFKIRPEVEIKKRIEEMEGMRF